MAAIHEPGHLIIAGVNKGGTTTLFSALGRHQDICPSSVKETCYFLPKRYGKDIEPEEVYRRYFEAADAERWLLEATPGYLYGGAGLVRALRQLTGDECKILVVLRDPVGRAFSFFRDKKSMLELPQDMAFSDYIEKCRALSPEELAREENNLFFALEGGKYADYLQPWLEEFGDDIRIVFFDELVGDQVATIRGICDWLGLDTELLVEQIEAGVKENRTLYPRFRWLQWLALRLYRVLEVFFRRHHRTKAFLTRFYYFLNKAEDETELLDPDDKAFLEDFYRSCNRRLAKQLAGRDETMPSWLERDLEK